MIKELIIIFALFHLCKNDCDSHCADCLTTITEFGLIQTCRKCIDGYFLDDSDCIKGCTPSKSEGGCKICDNDEKDECKECWDGYHLNEDRTACLPSFVYCGGEKFDECLRCGKTEINDTYSCLQCREMFLLIDGYCEWNINARAKSNFIKSKLHLVMLAIISILL